MRLLNKQLLWSENQSITNNYFLSLEKTNNYNNYINSKCNYFVFTIFFFFFVLRRPWLKMCQHYFRKIFNLWKISFESGAFSYGISYRYFCLYILFIFLCNAVIKFFVKRVTLILCDSVTEKGLKTSLFPYVDTTWECQLSTLFKYFMYNIK